MPSLLLVVFIVQLAIHLVNTVGAATVNCLLWNIYNRLPTPTSKSAQEQRELKHQFLKLRTEMYATSSQDEFAKWAKLRRQHDKVLEQLEKSKSTSDATKSTFDSVISALRWLSTNGLRMFLQFWYSKQAMFWIPKGWVPYYAEWLLSFPRAPLGSVSIQVWSLACAAIVLLASDVIVAITELILGTDKGSAQKGKVEPMNVAEEKPGSGQRAGTGKTKTEL